VVQYNSTDLGFITHKLASVGINYYFTLEQSGDAEEKLVMCDHHSFFQDCYDQAVDYHPAGDFLTDRRFVNSFRLTKRYMPGKVTLQGYQNSDPHKEVNSSRSISQGQSPEVRYFKGLKDSDQAKQVAKIREEEIASRLQDGQGTGNLFGFRAGTKFSLNPDPRDQKGAKYLITKVRHSFSRSVGYALSGEDASLSYDNTFYFVEDETPIRPQFITHRLPQTPGH
jgi:uncharacterized protein involved in type VI secretion and phage assembly